jgi:hypothetical protein
MEWGAATGQPIVFRCGGVRVLRQSMKRHLTSSFFVAGSLEAARRLLGSPTPQAGDRPVDSDRRASRSCVSHQSVRRVVGNN